MFSGRRLVLFLLQFFVDPQALYMMEQVSMGLYKTMLVEITMVKFSSSVRRWLFYCSVNVVWASSVFCLDNGETVCCVFSVAIQRMLQLKT